MAKNVCRSVRQTVMELEEDGLSLPQLKAARAVLSHIANLKTEPYTRKEELLKKLLKANGNDGTLALAFNGSNQYKAATPSSLVEYNGKYILTTDKGTYSFKPGIIVSEPVNGKTVTVPVMALTAPYAKSWLEEYFEGAPMKLSIRHSPIALGPLKGVTESDSIKKYQQKMVDWIKEKTGVQVISNDAALVLETAGLAATELEAARYTIDNNSIRVIGNVPLVAEKTIREQLFKAYAAQNKLDVDSLSDELKEVALKELKDKGLDVKMAIDGLAMYLDSRDKLSELTHEMIHAGALRYMIDPANKNSVPMKRMQELFDVAIANKEKIGRGMIEGSLINEYWTTNIHEFVAEALSNPLLINALMQVQVDAKPKLNSLFKQFIDTLLDMLGIKGNVKNNMFEYVLDTFTAMVKEQKENDERLNQSLLGVKLKLFDTPKLGSDAEMGIGSKATDTFVGQEELHLGQVLRAEFDNYYSLDIEAGNEIQTQEFNDLQDLILDTYESTMQDLGKGKVGLRLFESTVDQTAGQIDLRSKEMHIRWNKMSRLSRVSEVFLHEVNHLMSSRVFKNNSKLRALMENLRDSAVASGVTYKLFLEGIESPTENEIAIAKMKFDYTFDKTANPEEFYAYATTNEQVYNAIKNVKVTTPLIKQLEMDPNKKEPMKKVLNILIKTVNDVWRLLTGRGVAGGVMIKEMLLTIAKLDAEAMQRKRKVESEPDGITDYVKVKIGQMDEVLEPVMKQAEAWNEKFSAKQSAKWLANHLKRIPILNDLIETGISQYLWRMVTQDTTATDVADMYMVFRHAKQKVEKHTADIRNGVKSVVRELYKDEDEATKKAVTKIVLEGDLAQFSAAELKEYLADNKKIEIAIIELQKMIQPDETMMKQIDGLAEYLFTGTTKLRNQQINANNIVTEMYKTKKNRTNANPELVKMVDKLVSLKVLQKSDKTQIKLLSTLDEEVLDKTIQMYRSYIDNMRTNATISAYDPIPKGYTRPEDGLIKYELIPEEEIEAQKSVLMKLVDDKPYAVIEGKRYFLMTGRTKSVGFNEGAIGLISHTTEGIPVSSLIRKNNELNKDGGLMDGELRAKTKKIINAIHVGDVNVMKMFKLEAGQSLVPVYDHQYNIVDYRIQLTKLEKEIHLPDRKTELSDLLSHTFSRSVKTSLTATENKRVVDTIIEHSAKGILENPDEYVLVEEYTEEDRMNGVKREKRHDRWDYLPDHTKDYIYQKLRNKSIYIHKDFVELMTGEKDVTIGNFAKFGLDLKKYPVAKARLMALESYIAEILGYVKNAMVVLNADVLIGNQTSNAMVAIIHGIDPITYTKTFKERWAQLNEYNIKSQQLAELEVRRMAGENVKNKIKQLQRQLEGNVWDELVKDGQYTALVEDINIENQSEGQIYTMVNNYIEKKNWSGAVKTLRNMLYIDRTSALYGSMLKTVHYGDAITRQIIKEELEKKLVDKWYKKLKPSSDFLDTDKISKVVATNEAIAKLKELSATNPALRVEIEKDIQGMLNYLDQLLVNYGYTMNRWWKYAERVGGLFFMKYYLSQAKAIASMAKRVPTMLGLTQAAQLLSGIYVQDPLDTYLRSGIDGLAYRWMLDDSPEQLITPNLWELIPDISSAIKFK